MNSTIITNKKDLEFFIAQDYLRNCGNISKIKYLANKIYGTDSYMAFNYLRALRKYEYAINVQSKTFIGKIIYAYRKWVWHRLGVKYNLVLPPNVIGYGFKMSHIVGGGIIINCKSIGHYCSANAGVIVGNNGSQEKIATIGNNVSLLGAKLLAK